MFRPRVIPCLLLKNKGLVKTIKFKDPTYVGDPMNAIKIFNDLEADELAFLDITATNENRLLPLDVVEKIAEEAFMPFAVGGGIKSLGEIRQLLKVGAEKVIINTSSVTNPNLIREASDSFGNQSIIVSIDVKKDIWKKNKVYINSGKKKTSLEPVEHAKKMEQLGAGEIIINSIDRDGTMAGYDIDLIRQISESVQIPVIALGGAGSLNDFKEAIVNGRASAVAAGSMFVFHGPRRAVLISYPNKEDIKQFLGF